MQSFWKSIPFLEKHHNALINQISFKISADSQEISAAKRDLNADIADECATFDAIGRRRLSPWTRASERRRRNGIDRGELQKVKEVLAKHLSSAKYIAHIGLTTTFELLFFPFSINCA